MGKTKSFLNNGESNLFKNKGSIENNGRVYYHLANLCKNRFKWENLPPGIESRHIERGLYENGQVFFVDDPQLGILCLPCSPAGQLNVYNEPINLNVWGIGYSKLFNIDEGIRLIENEECIPARVTIRYYADLIDSIENTIRLNLEQQKFPYIIPTTKETEATMKAMYKKIVEGEPALFIDKRLENGGESIVKVLKTDSPYLLDKLSTFLKDTYSQVYTVLGINNNSQNDKKERMIVDEINVNNSHILLNLEMAYIYRKNAADAINKKFGTNIKVVKVIEELEDTFKGETKDKVITTTEGVEE